MFGISALWAALGLWPTFVVSVLTGMIFILFIGLNLWNFKMGYLRGLDDFAEALVKAESGPEFARLLEATPPKPWE